MSQIHSHYEGKKTSHHRRNLAITGGVALSIITAPVIAAVSVGEYSSEKYHIYTTGSVRFFNKNYFARMQKTVKAYLNDFRSDTEDNSDFEF